MTNDHHLNDYTHADRALERLRQKQEAETTERRMEWGQAVAFAAVLAVLLWLAGVL